MERDRNGRRRAGLSRSLVVGTLLTATWLSGLALIPVSKPLSGAETSGGGLGTAPPVCAGWHRGDGRSRLFDLEATERGYREFRESLSQAFSKSLSEQVPKPSLPAYGAGLPSCTGAARRRGTPAQAVPDALRGRRLWFFIWAPGKTPRLPDQAENDPAVVPLASQVERLDDLAKVSKALGRSVSLAPKGLAEALGVRCVPALVTISKEGEVEIHEAP